MEIGINGDDLVMSQMPKDYWLKGAKTKHLLACMVHRRNKEIASQCLSLTAGQSSEIQRSNATTRVATEHAEAKKAHKREDKEDKEEMRVRRIHANIGEMSLIKSWNNLVATQLELYTNNKVIFCSSNGPRTISKW